MKSDNDTKNVVHRQVASITDRSNRRHDLVRAIVYFRRTCRGKNWYQHYSTQQKTLAGSSQTTRCCRAHVHIHVQIDRESSRMYILLHLRGRAYRGIIVSSYKPQLVVKTVEKPNSSVYLFPHLRSRLAPAHWISISWIYYPATNYRGDVQTE